nr:MAG TPA: peptidase [Microviridae sp.]
MNHTLMDFLEYLLYFNVHFTITSARRTPEQNKACNGVPTSQHLSGEAIDIKPYGSTTYSQLFEHIQNYSDNTHVFDQLILYPTFIHISFGKCDRRQLIDKRK